jgi:pimeloyl-ACP methyl ester carboxylesterase
LTGVATRPKTFVLIPGAWLGGWVWDAVARGLRDRGYRAEQLTLSGLGDGEDASGIGLAAHVDDVLRVLEAGDLVDAFVVGHLYSGLVAGQVADRAPERVAHSVFVEAFLPRDGRAMVDALTASGRAAELRAIDENGGWWPPPTFAEVAEGNGLSNEQARQLTERFVPHPGRTISEPAVMTRPLAEQRATYIAAALGSHAEAEDVRALRGEPNWTFRKIDTGHWPMVSAPDELVALLDEVVTRV